jgi:hypothetical protein
MADIRGRNSRTLWRKFFPISKPKSSSDPILPKDLKCCHGAGSSSEPSPGSIAAGGSPRIGKISIARRSRSCASHQSALCCENYAIRPDVSGQTLRQSNIFPSLIELIPESPSLRPKPLACGKDKDGRPANWSGERHCGGNRLLNYRMCPDAEFSLTSARFLGELELVPCNEYCPYMFDPHAAAISSAKRSADILIAIMSTSQIGGS